MFHFKVDFDGALQAERVNVNGFHDNSWDSERFHLVPRKVPYNTQDTIATVTELS